jgi:hypothetical protein
MAKKGKKTAGAGGKRADSKLAKRLVEDKTFGLKNKKKSKKVQQYVASVKTSVDARMAVSAKMAGRSVGGVSGARGCGGGMPLKS